MVVLSFTSTQTAILSAPLPSDWTSSAAALWGWIFHFFCQTRGREWFPHSAHNVVLYFKLDDRPLVHCDLADVKRVC